MIRCTQTLTAVRARWCQSRWASSVVGVEQLPDFPATNEPVLGYLSGSAERQELQDALKATAADCTDVPIVIGGEHIRTRDVRYQVMPHDHSKRIAKFYYADSTVIGGAIEKAVAAQRAWDRRPLAERLAIWETAAQLMAGKYRARLNAATMLGQSKTAIQAEIDSAAELVDFIRLNAYFLKEAAKYQPISPQPTVTRNTMRFRGIDGFVAAISPFNFTAIGGNLAYTPALAGNAVLWKPSDTALLSNWLIYQIMTEAGVPPGVVNFVPADGPTFGNAITKSPHLAGINFTGSVPSEQISTDEKLQYRQISYGNNVAEYAEFDFDSTGKENKTIMVNVWTEEKREKLIELVRNEESIWRKASKNHRRTDEDQRKWQMIASELGITVDQAQKEWNALKKSFYYQKNQKAPSGSEGGNRKYKSKNSMFFQKLSFLQDNLRGRRQIDTMRNVVLNPSAPDFESDTQLSAFDPLASSPDGENIHSEDEFGDTRSLSAGAPQVTQTIPRRTESLQPVFRNNEASQDIGVLLREADELCSIDIVSSLARGSEEVPRAETFEDLHQPIPHTSRNSDSSRSSNIRAPRNITEVPQPTRNSGSRGRSTSAFQVESFPARPGRTRNVETENRRDRFYDNLNQLIGTTQESLRENLRELAAAGNSPESHSEINGFLQFLKSVMEPMTSEMFKEFRLKILKLYIETVNTD